MEKSIVVIGAGKIGRGSVALFFSRAGWDVSLYGHSMEKMRDLEAQGYYETRNELGEMDRVEGFRILDCTDDSALVETLTKGCNLAALALYEGAFPSVGASIGRVIKARVAVGNPEPINFMLCVNAPTALDELEAAFLDTLDEAELEYYRTKVGMCYTLVQSLGANPRPEDNRWLVLTSSWGELRIDSDEWKGELLEGVDRVSYVAHGRALIYRKVFIANMSHAYQGFIATTRGQHYMDEGIAEDLWVRENMHRAQQEAFFALSNTFEFEPDELSHFWEHVVELREGRQSHDPIARVCNSPEKKISRTNRFIWAALKCLELGRLPYYLARGAAYGLFYIVSGHGKEPVEAPRTEAEVKSLVDRFCGLTEDEYVLRDLIAGHYMDIPGTALLPEKQQ